MSQEDALKLALAEKFGSITLAVCERGGCGSDERAEAVSYDDLFRGEFPSSHAKFIEFKEGQVQ